MVQNPIHQNMILDSLIVRLAINGKCLPPQISSTIERLIRQVQELKSKSVTSLADLSTDATHHEVKSLRYFHPTIAINASLARLSAKLCTDWNSSNTESLKRLIQYAQMNGELANQMHFFLRAILLSVEDTVPLEMWMNLLRLLLECVDTKSIHSGDTIYFIVYLLTRETNGQKQIELLRGLTKFAAAKENIPMILNIYRLLSISSKGILKIQAIDLYTRLWLVENRCYQFLHKVLVADDETKLTTPHRWEMNIVKAQAIKDICLHK